MKMVLKSGLDSQKVSLCNHLRNPIPKRILLNLVMIRSKRNLSTGMWPGSQMRNPSFSEGMKPDPHQYVMSYSNRYLEPHILTGLPLPNEPEEIGNAKIGESFIIS